MSNPDVVSGLSQFNKKRQQAAENDEREDKKIAFFNAITTGDRPTFNKYVVDFANDRIPVFTAQVRVDSSNRTVIEHCESAPQTLVPGVDIRLFQRIVEKGYMPATCPDNTTQYNLTALMVATLYGQAGMAKALIDAGADQEDTIAITYFEEPKQTGFFKARAAPKGITKAWKAADFKLDGGRRRSRRMRRVRRTRKGVRRTLRRK